MPAPDPTRTGEAGACTSEALPAVVSTAAATAAAEHEPGLLPVTTRKCVAGADTTAGKCHCLRTASALPHKFC